MRRLRVWRWRHKLGKSPAGYGGYESSGKPGREKKLNRWQGQMLAAFILGVLICGIFQHDSPQALQCQQFLRFYNSKQADWSPTLALLCPRGFWMDSFNREVYESTLSGLSLEAEMMSIPVSGKFAKGFGWSEVGSNSQREFHAGIDIRAVSGIPVRAALAGEVGVVGEDPQEGKFIEVKHRAGLVTRYAGLGEILVRPGQMIRQDQIIAQLGAGALLHFEIKEKGQPIDPLTRLVPSGGSI
jgi:murein DD-endopeptidase MepM/ murein hydrolase activator NlpD